jgi:hypothetical protein
MIDIKDIDLNNPIMVRDYSPLAEWKRALLVRLGELFNLPTLIETGTCVGDTVETVREHFKDVWSVELSSHYYEIAKKRFANITNVHLVFGSSGETLPSIIDNTTGPLLFWLDAHVTGGDSVDNGDQIESEIRTISRMRPNSLIVIDDTFPDKGGYGAPDISPIVPPEGWKMHFLSGVLLLHAGSYQIPERF